MEEKWIWIRNKYLFDHIITVLPLASRYGYFCSVMYETSACLIVYYGFILLVKSCGNTVVYEAYVG